jgi:hypothetical protein
MTDTPLCLQGVGIKPGHLYTSAAGHLAPWHKKPKLNCRHHNGLSILLFVLRQIALFYTNPQLIYLLHGKLGGRLSGYCSARQSPN